jgi:hypothetical protein
MYRRFGTVPTQADSSETYTFHRKQSPVHRLTYPSPAENALNDTVLNNVCFKDFETLYIGRLYEHTV